MSNPLVPENGAEGARRDIGGMLCAALFILLGGVCLYQTTRMIDPDSYVFPRMVISGLMGLSLILIVSSLLNPNVLPRRQQNRDVRPSTVRRVLLVLSMMVATLLMPFVGFLLSGLGVFMALMFLANHDAWSRGQTLLYLLVGGAIVVGFYGGFTFFLQVSLPEGSWVQWP